MANSKLSMDGPAFEGSTSEVILPDHVMPLQVEANVDTPILHTPPGSPAPQEEQGGQAADTLENSVLKCIMEDASDPLHAFQEYEHYSRDFNYESDCEVLEFEDELTDEMKDMFSGDLNQLFPVNSQEEEGSTEGDHGQQSPGNLSQDTMAIEENIKLSVVNIPATEPEDPSTLRHLDEMEVIVANEEDQLVPVNSQDTQHFTEDDYDQSIPVIISVENVANKQDGLIPVNLQEEEDPTAQLQGIHDQMSPVIIPVEDTISPEGNESCPVNLHLTVVNGTEPEADQEVIPDISSDKSHLVLVKVQGNHGQQGMVKQELEDVTVIHPLKSEEDKNILLNSGTQQADDLNTFQKGKEFSKVEGSEMERLGILPTYSCISQPGISDVQPTTEPTDASNKESYQPLFLGQDKLSRSPDGAMKFTMADLNIITGNFSESLMVEQLGGSGSVYRGQLKDGTTVAVKRIKKNDKNVLGIEDAKDFESEADILFKEIHVNLVRLLGFLEDKSELILVTEYVANGNLRQHLDGVPYGVILDMPKRCRISLDVIAALKHLHNQANDDVNIIHRNIKSSDILITNDFCAKVAGFDLSQHSPFGDGTSSTSTQVKRTLGYMTSENSTSQHLKEKNDVYSFGALLVEIFTGKCLFELRLLSDECFTTKWVLKHCMERRLMDVIDPKITPTTLNLKILEQIFKLVASCLALEESNCPTVEDLFRDLSFIVDHYFGNLKDESNSIREKYEVQEEQKGHLKEYIEPNIQTLCLEASKALERQELALCIDKRDSSDPLFLPTKPHHGLFIEGSKNNKAQTSTQLGIQLDMDSKQATRQASEVLITSQDQTSPLFVDIMADVFQLKSNETYFKMLQEEIAKLGYISRLLHQGDAYEQNLTNIYKISFFLYFNEKDDVFEFYFKNYQDMASIIGVGLVECAKVVLEDGWRVTIQEISQPNWDDAWKNFDSSSSTMKITIPRPLEESTNNMEDSQEALASIPRGQCLLLDLAQYFILEKAIASFLPKASMTHANTNSGTSSSSSNQDTARSSSSSDGKFSMLLQSLKNMFSSREASNQLKTKNDDGPPIDPLGDNDGKFDTTVHLKLLPGGCLFDGNNPLNATISNDKELETLASQLDNSIYLVMMFKFLNEVDKKEIHVTVGPISFQFQEKNEDNYNSTGRFGWYHKFLEVSFRPIDASCSEIGPDYKALDIVKVKKTKTIGSSDATTHGTSKSMNGGVEGKIPHIMTLYGGIGKGWSTTNCISDNLGHAFEKDFEETSGGFAITPERNMLSSTLKYTYRTPDYMDEIDYGKLSCEDYRKFVLHSLPICISQDVKFEGTWLPMHSENNPQEVVEYSLCTSREVHMTRKEISEKVVKKPWIKMMCGQSKIQKENNEPLKYTQKYARRIFVNHAMTHLNGEEFKVREVLSQRPLNQGEPETHLKDHSRYAPQWCANPLLRLNSELEFNHEL